MKNTHLRVLRMRKRSLKEMEYRWNLEEEGDTKAIMWQEMRNMTLVEKGNKTGLQRHKAPLPVAVGPMFAVAQKPLLSCLACICQTQPQGQVQHIHQPSCNLAWIWGKVGSWGSSRSRSMRLGNLVQPVEFGVLVRKHITPPLKLKSTHCLLERRALPHQSQHGLGCSVHGSIVRCIVETQLVINAFADLLDVEKLDDASKI